MFIMMSLAKSVAQKMPGKIRSSGIPEVSSTMYLLSVSTLVLPPMEAAEPVTKRVSTTERCFVSCFAASTLNQSGSVGVSFRLPSPSNKEVLSKVMPKLP